MVALEEDEGKGDGVRRGSNFWEGREEELGEGKEGERETRATTWKGETRGIPPALANV